MRAIIWQKALTSMAEHCRRAFIGMNLRWVRETLPTSTRGISNRWRWTGRWCRYGTGDAPQTVLTDACSRSFRAVVAVRCDHVVEHFVTTNTHEWCLVSTSASLPAKMLRKKIHGQRIIICLRCLLLLLFSHVVALYRLPLFRRRES